LLQLLEGYDARNSIENPRTDSRLITQIVHREEEHRVERRERAEVPEIAPAVPVRHVQGRQVGVRHGEPTEPALLRVVRVVDGRQGGLRELPRVLAACHPGGRVEDVDLCFRAADGHAVRGGRHHRGDEVREGGDVVGEVPEPDELGQGLHDAREGQDERVEEDGQHGGGLGVRGHDGQALREARVVQLVEHEDEPHHGAPAARDVLPPPDREVPADEAERGDDEVERDLHRDAGDDEDGPVVHLGVLLAHLVKLPVLDKPRLQLHDDHQRQEKEHKHGEGLVLQACDGIGFLVEGETEEQPADEVDECLAHDVHRASPVLLEETLLHGDVLLQPGHGVSARRRRR